MCWRSLGRAICHLSICCIRRKKLYSLAQKVVNNKNEWTCRFRCKINQSQVRNYMKCWTPCITKHLKKVSIHITQKWLLLAVENVEKTYMSWIMGKSNKKIVHSWQHTFNLIEALSCSLSLFPSYRRRQWANVLLFISPLIK